jgi:hypothetical protein
MNLTCVTNDTKGVRSCTVRGEHTQACTGWKGDRECTGCLPRQAEHGLLCWSCWERLVQVYTRWDEFTGLLDGVDRAVQRDNAGVRSSSASHIPLPGTWLAIDECKSFLGSMTGMIDEWVSRTRGAKDAVMFTVSAERAYRAYPIEEKSHRLKRQRCPKCSQQTLVWHPPQYFGDHVRVACSDEVCGQEMDQRSFETLASIEGRVR